MFYIIDKSKIYSYIIAVSIVFLLFMIASSYNSIKYLSNNTIETSTDIYEENKVNEIL